MFRRAAILLLLSSPVSAQSFTTELSFAFGYAGGKVDEPVVTVDGVVSPRYAYRQDSTGRALSLGAVRYFGGVVDDGATPYALLPFVARRSSLGASVSFSGVSRDSYGIALLAGATVESRLTADASTWAGTIDGTHFVLPGWAVHVVAGGASFRETQSLSSVRTPGGSVFGSVSPREDRLSGSLGVLARPGAGVAVEASVVLGSVDARATYAGVFPGASPFTDAESDFDTSGAALSARVLLLERRLALDASGRYLATHGGTELHAPGGTTASTAHVIARSIGGTATWFAGRALSLELGIDYASAGTTQGEVSELYTAWRRGVVWRTGARYFARANAWAALEVSRAEADTVTPPERASFTRFRATDVRVALTAALRM